MLNKNSIFSIFLFVPTAFGAQTTFLKSSWNLQHTPDQFAHDVAMSCLTAAAAHVKTEGKMISLEDDQHCSEELKLVSLVWDKNPEVPMMSINTKRRDETKMLHALEDHYGPFKPDEIKILSSDASASQCPCMIVSGSKAKEAASFLRNSAAPVQ